MAGTVKAPDAGDLRRRCTAVLTDAAKAASVGADAHIRPPGHAPGNARKGNSIFVIARAAGTALQR